MAKMPKLPIISGKDAVKAFKKDSWVINRQAGDHIIISKENSEVVLYIPQHKSLKKGTIRKLIKISGLTVEEFVKLL